MQLMQQLLELMGWGWGRSGGAQQRERQTQPGLGAELQLNSSSAKLIAEIAQEPYHLLKSDAAQDLCLSDAAPAAPRSPVGAATRNLKRNLHHTCCLTPSACHFISYFYEALGCIGQLWLGRGTAKPC